MYKVFFGKVTGPQHSRKGEESQDSYAYEEGKDYLIMAVADGAGSHSQSKTGSQLTVDFIKYSISNHLTVNDELSKEYCEELLFKAQENLHSQEDYKEKGCTVSFAVVKGGRWWAGVVGDAFVVVHLRNGEHLLIQPVRESEYSNITELLSNKTIHPHVVSSDEVEESEVKALSVSSDGLLLKTVERGEPVAGFWTPLVNRFEAGELNLQALVEYMDDKELLDDDTTIIFGGVVED